MDRKGPPAIRGLAQSQDALGAFGARNDGRCSLAALVCGVVCCLAWGLRPVRHTPSVGPAVPVPFAAPYLPIRSRLLHATLSLLISAAVFAGDAGSMAMARGIPKGHINGGSGNTPCGAPKAPANTGIAAGLAVGGVGGGIADQRGAQQV